MTEQLKVAGVSLANFLERNWTGVVSAVFALGFVWAQFDGLRGQLTETRSELKRFGELYHADRSKYAAGHRDVERLVAEAAFQRERLISQRMSIHAIEGRVAKLEALRDGK
ncbi:MAG: hypothetical protein MRY74_05780 [Neomegalonema sp.]|nr:hypothetical protein [Neomegalonema sp.]